MALERGTWRPRAVAQLGNFTKLAAATSPSFCVAVVRLGWPPNACLGEARQTFVAFRMDRSDSVRTDSSALGLNSLVCVLMPRFVAAF
jgi:hypothetical protein